MVAVLGFFGVSVARPVPRVLPVGRALFLLMLSRETVRLLRLRKFGRSGFIGNPSLSFVSLKDGDGVLGYTNDYGFSFEV